MWEGGWGHILTNGKYMIYINITMFYLLVIIVRVHFETFDLGRYVGWVPAENRWHM